MFASDPVGLPGLAAVALGFVAFILAGLRARGRREPEAAGKRSRQSQIGIGVQALGFLCVTVGGPKRVVLDPLGAPALGEAVLIALLMGGCVALFVASSRAMGRNWSLVARTRDDHQLVQSGPFAHIRHPIYTGLFLMMIALAIAFGHIRALVLAIPLYALGTWLRISVEERMLRTMFAASYDNYAARVKRFVPGIF